MFALNVISHIGPGLVAKGRAQTALIKTNLIIFVNILEKVRRRKA